LHTVPILPVALPSTTTTPVATLPSIDIPLIAENILLYPQSQSIVHDRANDVPQAGSFAGRAFSEEEEAPTQSNGVASLTENIILSQSPTFVQEQVVHVPPQAASSAKRIFNDEEERLLTQIYNDIVESNGN
jgi:hypothetical protein